MQWRTTLGAGAGLGVVVVAWGMAAAAANLTGIFVPVAMALQVIALAGLMWATRKDHAYGQQVLAGTAASAVAAVLIFGGSLVTTVVLFPDSLELMRTETEASMRAAGAAADEIQAAVASLTPLAQALGGVIGTLVTGIVLSLLIAIGLRRR